MSRSKQLRFTHIKCNGKLVELEWQTPLEGSEADVVRHSLESKDAPHPDFPKALLALAPWVAKLLELPPRYVEKLQVTGLHINWPESGGMGLVVTCVRPLERANAPLVLNTPYLAEASDEDTGNFLPDDVVALVQAAMKQAQKFTTGAREQGNLFAMAGAE